MQTKASLAGHPAHMVLVHFPIAFLGGSLVVKHLIGPHT